MPEPTPEAWAQIRHDYEHTDRPIVDICAAHGITDPMLRYRVKRWKWQKRRSLIPRQGPPPVPVMAEIEQAAALAQPTPTPTLPLSEGGSSGAAPHPTPPEAAIPYSASGENPPHPISSPCSEIDLSPHAGRGDDAAIVPRLQSAVARVLPAIEATIARLAAGSHHPRDVEQAGRALSSLTRTLRELNTLLAQHKAGPDHQRCECREMSPEDIDAFRDNLARRIRAFVASRTNAGGAQPGSALPRDAPK